MPLFKKTETKRSFSGFKTGNFLTKYSHLIGLFILCLILTLTSPYFLTVSNIINVLRQASLLLVLSCGMTLVILTGGIDLSVGAVAALTSCLAGPFLLVDHSIASMIIGIIIALGAGVLCGLTNGLMVAKVKLPPFISSFGVQYVTRGLALLIVGGNIIYGFKPEFRWLGAGKIFDFPVPIIVAALVFLCIWFLSKKTTWGRSVYATGANLKGAWLSGIHVDRVLIGVYTLNGFIAAFTGLMYMARLNAAEPGFGMGYELNAIASTVIGGTFFVGGVGGVSGTIVGALIMTLIINALNLYGISPLWQQALTGAIVIAAVLADVLSQKKNK